MNALAFAAVLIPLLATTRLFVMAATVAELDAAIAVGGVGASLLSLAVTMLMLSIKHKLARSVALESIADFFAASCTTVFAYHTFLGWPVDAQHQVILRALILIPNVITQVHLVWVVLQIVSQDMKGGDKV